MMTMKKIKLLSSRSMFLEEGSDSSDNEDEKVLLR